MTTLALPSVMDNQGIVINEAAGVWMAAWVRVHSERTFVDEMLSRGYPAYCPLSARYAKKKMIQEPAFPQYVFVAIPHKPNTREYFDAMYEVKGSGRLAQRMLIDIRNQKKFIREINDVRQVLDIDPAVQMSKCYLPGREVRVIKGIWAHPDRIARIDGMKAGQVCIFVEALLGGAMLQVGADEIELLD